MPLLLFGRGVIVATASRMGFSNAEMESKKTMEATPDEEFSPKKCAYTGGLRMFGPRPSLRITACGARKWKSRIKKQLE